MKIKDKGVPVLSYEYCHGNEMYGNVWVSEGIPPHTLNFGVEQPASHPGC